MSNIVAKLYSGDGKTHEFAAMLTQKGGSTIYRVGNKYFIKLGVLELEMNVETFKELTGMMLTFMDYEDRRKMLEEWAEAL